MITTALTILLFLLILTLIVCIHELGHFTLAKIFKVTVEEFSVGMGPLIYKKIFKGTQYSVRCLPIGGYVKMLGEGNSVDQPGSYSVQKGWKKLLIIYAGVLMNFILTAFLLTLVAFKTNGIFYGVTLSPNYSFPIADSHVIKVGIAGVENNSPAQKAGLQTLDVINTVNKVDYSDFKEYSDIIGNNLGKNIPFQVIPALGGNIKNVNFAPRDPQKDNLSQKQTATGIVLGPAYVRAEFQGLSLPFSGILQTINEVHNTVYTLKDLVKLSVQQKDASYVSNSLVGPVGTYEITQKVISINGAWGVITLIALLSLAIGTMNALPFPALDGWHGVFILFEMITRKKVNEKLYNAITLGGFVVLLALGVLISIKDILNYNTLFH